MKILCLVVTLSFLAAEAASVPQKTQPSPSARKLNYPRPHKKRFFKRQNKVYKPTNHLKVFSKMRQRGMGKKILYTRKDRAYRAILKPRNLKAEEVSPHRPIMKKIMLKNSAIDKIVEQAEAEAKNHRKLKSTPAKKQPAEKEDSLVETKPKKEEKPEQKKEATAMKKTRKLSSRSNRKNNSAPITSHRPKKIDFSRKARIEANKHFQEPLRFPSKGKFRKLAKKGPEKSSDLAQPAQDGSIELQKDPKIEVDTEAMKKDLGII